jgi:hypothetical protein
MQALRSEQAALHQSLQQLGRNLQDAAERTAAVNREVGAALARANVNMQQTLEALRRGDLPTHEAQQTVESLNRLGLALLNNAGQMGSAEAASGAQETRPQLANLARQQGSLAGQSNALEPMSLSAAAMAQQLERLAAEQMELARQLGNLTAAERARLGDDVEPLAREAEGIAQQLSAGALPAHIAARQERLFHRLLEAGRTLEKDEYEETRLGERPDDFDPIIVAPLDARLFQDTTRYRPPSAETLRALPPAYRRLIQDYFERLNRPVPPAGEPAGR